MDWNNTPLIVIILLYIIDKLIQRNDKKKNGKKPDGSDERRIADITWKTQTSDQHVAIMEGLKEVETAFHNQTILIQEIHGNAKSAHYLCQKIKDETVPIKDNAQTLKDIKEDTTKLVDRRST